MIARPDDCNTGQLALMLDDQLDVEQQRSITAHLDRCQTCRDELERIASEGGDWWSDTREVLRDLTEAERSAIEVPDHSHWHGNSRGELGSTANRQRPLHAEFDQNAANGKEHWVIGLLDPATDNDPGTLGYIDGLPIHSVVGQGGMGVVLMARDEHLHRFLAIKLLSPMLASAGAARQRFLREAQAAAAVVHPNIVPIYAVSAERKLPYIVMPYIAGGNLQQLLDATGPLPIERSLSIALQVAEGLVAAHQQGIVHRDIKPANLMLDEGGFRVLITDFGLARALDDSTLTGSGMLAGTPQFMSPEQASGRNLDQRSDIYSLGAVLYALATGRPPIRGTSTLETLRHIMEESPKPIVEINESYPLWFQKLVDRFMTKDVERRIQTAEEAAELLRTCLAHARAPTQAALPSDLLAEKRNSPNAWIVVGGIVAIVLISLWFAPYGKSWLVERGRGAGGTPNGLQENKGALLAPEADGESLESATTSGQPDSPTLPSIVSAEQVDVQLEAMEQDLLRLQSELGSQPLPGLPSADETRGNSSDL